MPTVLTTTCCLLATPRGHISPVSLGMEQFTAEPSTILSRATFLTIMFSGSAIMSSFQLSQDYQSSLLGIPAHIVSQEPIDTHKEKSAIWAVQKILWSRPPNIPVPSMFTEREEIWIWYKTTKKTESDEWFRARIINIKQHYLEVCRLRNGILTKGATMKPAYEDVRIIS